METFTCDLCEETFEEKGSDEESLVEYKESDYYVPDADTNIICDTCYKIFLEWFGIDTDLD